MCMVQNRKMIAGICHDLIFFFQNIFLLSGLSQIRRIFELPTLTPRLSWKYTHNLRGVAQLEARCVWDAEARGSSPRSPTEMGNA